MKIVYNGTDKDAQKLEGVGFGSVFSFGGNYFILTEAEEDGNQIVLRLNDFSLIDLDPKTRVVVVDAELVIKGPK